MFDITSTHLAVSPSLLGRLMASKDRLLPSGVRMEVRNDDLPCFEL